MIRVCSVCTLTRVSGDRCSRCESSRFHLRCRCAQCGGYIERTPGWFAKRAAPYMCSSKCESDRRERERDLEEIARRAALIPALAGEGQS